MHAPLLPNRDDGSRDMESKISSFCCWISTGCFGKMVKTVTKLWDFGLSDRIRFIFPAKMGLALTLLSFLIFLKEPFQDLSSHSVWAILTVVVVFEISIGSTLRKGFNRFLGTVLAAGLALAVAHLSILTGDYEELVIIVGIYIVGFLTNFLKLYPTMKPYEYGFRVFLITFCFIVVSGYKTGTFVQTAVNRSILICIGAVVALAVNVFIYPIWAGEDLHELIAKNFDNVATSVEGCVNAYLACIEYKRIPSNILTYEASDDPLYTGYRSAVESKTQENELLGFAVWEPPHGRYKMLKYPWKSFIKVSGALRHCAFAVMALHGCILSEIQAPPKSRLVFRNELENIGIESAKVLREVGDRIKKMRKLGSGDILSEVNKAAEELQDRIDKRSYILVNSEKWEIGRRQETNLDGEEGGGGGKEADNSSDLNHFAVKSQSEAVLDLRYVELAIPNDRISENSESSVSSEHQDFEESKGTSWHERQPSYHMHTAINLQSRIYESASELSLATFASLLIEFVARLSNLVDCFEELCEHARFQENE